MNTASIVQKIWSYCDVLRDVGVSYGDYLEQLTYLLFLKMRNAPWFSAFYTCVGCFWYDVSKLSTHLENVSIKPRIVNRNSA